MSNTDVVAVGAGNEQGVQIREGLATGELFVTSLEDVRIVRDRAVDKAMLAERERCAKVAEEFESDMGHGIPQQIADRIRSGK